MSDQPEAAAAAEPERYVIRTVRCPACGQLGAPMFGPTLTACRTPERYCNIITFDMTMSVIDQLSQPLRTHNLDTGESSDGPPLIEPGHVDDRAHRPAPPQVDPLADALAEAELRNAMHTAWSAACEGGCPVCDPTTALTAGHQLIVAEVAREVGDNITGPLPWDLLNTLTLLFLIDRRGHLTDAERDEAVRIARGDPDVMWGIKGIAKVRELCGDPGADLLRTLLRG